MRTGRSVCSGWEVEVQAESTLVKLVWALLLPAAWRLLRLG